MINSMEASKLAKQNKSLVEMVNLKITEAANNGKYEVSIDIKDSDLKVAGNLDKTLTTMGYGVEFGPAKNITNEVKTELYINWEDEEEED